MYCHTLVTIDISTLARITVTSLRRHRLDSHSRGSHIIDVKRMKRLKAFSSERVAWAPLLQQQRFIHWYNVVSDVCSLGMLHMTFSLVFNMRTHFDLSSALSLRRSVAFNLLCSIIRCNLVVCSFSVTLVSSSLHCQYIGTSFPSLARLNQFDPFAIMSARISKVFVYGFLVSPISFVLYCSLFSQMDPWL